MIKIPSKAAGLALVIVLLLLAAFAVTAAMLTNRAVVRAHDLTAVSTAYENARFGVGEEESFERKYRLEPGPEVRALYQRAVRNVLEAMREVARKGNAEDAAVSAHVLSLHRPYLVAIKEMFAAVDRRDTSAVLRIDRTGVDPTFGEIEKVVEAAADRHRVAAVASLDNTASVTRHLDWAAPAVFAFGLVLLTLLWRVRRNEQRLTEDELTRRNVLLADQAQRLQRTLEDRERAEMELAEATDRLRHAQRLEAVGQLAGGVAHDFNNLLQIILGYCALLESESEGESARQLGEIATAARRGADLTSQLLAFGGRQVLNTEVWDVNKIVVGIEEMLARVLPSTIDFTTVPARGELCARVDRGQFEQVLVNLVLNARDAMPEGGPLTIFTEAIDVDESMAIDDVELPAGPYVRIAVRDTGSGMDEKTKTRALEPFFTTKERGEGTGLGLATAYGIIRQSGGFVSLESELGVGTEVDVWLPVTSEPAAASTAAASASQERAAAVKRVLLVEDEPDVRAVLATYLRTCGYDVLEARDGREGLDVFEEHGDSIDLLLTDIVMPRLDGWGLVAAVRHVDARLPIIVMSGFSGDLPTGADDWLERLAKPFRPADVADAIERVAARPRVA